LDQVVDQSVVRSAKPSDLERFAVVGVVGLAVGIPANLAGLPFHLPALDVNVEIGPGVAPAAFFIAWRVERSV
jgi:hypothetical protein